MTSSRDLGRYACLPGDAWRTAPLSGLSLEAFGLVMRCWAFFSDQQTDGYLPQHELVAVAKGAVRRSLIAELLESGVWVEEPRGYRCTVYLSANISREEWELKKAKDADRKERSRREAKSRERDREVMSSDGPQSVTRDSRVTSRGEAAESDRDPQTPGHQDTRTPRSAGSASDAGARPTPGSLRDSDREMRAALLDGFGRRWAAALGEGQWSQTANPAQIALVLDAVRTRVGPEGELERGLDGYFAHCAATKTRPEFGWLLSRDFGRWIAASSLPAGESSGRTRRLDRLKRLAEAPIPSPEGE